MTKEEKIAVAKEVFEHLGDITKEQYLEFCKLCDDLDLAPIPPDPEDLSWDEIMDEVDK